MHGMTSFRKTLSILRFAVTQPCMRERRCQRKSRKCQRLLLQQPIMLRFDQVIWVSKFNSGKYDISRMIQFVDTLYRGPLAVLKTVLL